MEYESITQRVLLGSVVLSAFMSGENMTLYILMATVQENAMCELWFLETNLVIKTQPRYRTQYGKDPLSDNAIRHWLKQFQETGSVLHRKIVGRPSTSQENFDRIQEAWTFYVPGRARMLKLFSIL
jgi:hypothetical protein